MQSKKSENCSSNWSDDYKETINKAEFTEEFDFRSEMRNSMWNWINLTDYRKIRNLYTKEYENKLKSSIRLEIGNANDGSYYFIWIFDIGDLAKAITNINNSEDGQSFTEIDISHADYKRLWENLGRLDAWKLKSNAESFTMDGSTYFVSICFAGKSHQFAIYAPLLDEKAAKSRDWENFYKKTKKQSEVINQILNFANIHTKS